MMNRLAIGILLAASAGVSIAQETNRPGRVFVTDGNAGAYIENFVTNLPTTIRVANGVLTFEDHGTNLWTSTESHDWGSWLPSGAPNPSDEAVSLNLPLTLQPVGTEWAVAGGFAVLALSPGVSMQVLSDEASVKWIFPDGSSWKWLAESAIDVPAAAKSIRLATVNGEEVVHIDYAVSDGAADLSILRSENFAGSYTTVTNVSWDQVSANTRRATIPTGGAQRAFFRARVAASVPAHIQATCPVFLPSGIMTSASDINPVVYDSVVTIEVGGKQYRLAAEEVQ